MLVPHRAHHHRHRLALLLTYYRGGAKDFYRRHHAAILVLENVTVEHKAAFLLRGLERYRHEDSPSIAATVTRWYRDSVVPCIDACRNRALGLRHNPANHA